MATIEKYSTTTGSARYRVRYRTPDRKQTDKRGFTTKKAASDFATSVEGSKLTGQYVAPAGAMVTIGDLGPAWLGRQTHLKPSAFRPLEIAWRIHVEPRWGKSRIGDLRFTDVQQWVSDLSSRRGASVVIRAFGVLAGVLDDAVRDRLVLTNPARGVSLPRKTRGEHTYLSHPQVWALADAAGKNGALILLLSYTGLRWGEASGLRVKDLDLLRRRVSVVQNAVRVGGIIHVGTPKSHRTRTVPIPAGIVEQLARRCEGRQRDDLLFEAPMGGYLKAPNGTRGWFERARIVADLPRLTPHDLRHSAASLSVSAGANVKAVQRMLGHASAAETLDTYADLFSDDLTAVADRLDAAMISAKCGQNVGTAPVADLTKRADLHK